MKTNKGVFEKKYQSLESYVQKQKLVPFEKTGCPLGSAQNDLQRLQSDYCGFHNMESQRQSYKD